MVNRYHVSRNGFVFLDIIFGLFVFSLLLPVIFSIFNSFTSNVTDMKTTLLHYTEIDFIRDVVTQDLEFATQVLDVNEGVLEVLTVSGKRIQYSLKNNRLRRQVNGRSTRYLTQFLECDEFSVILDKEYRNLLLLGFIFNNADYYYSIKQAVTVNKN